MNEPGTPRVAVYLDFDNIVISRYDQIHGRNSFQRDKTAGFHKAPGRLTTATVDVGAIIDFASSFGTLVLTKAYADWSVDVNAEYRGQLVGRAVDLVQLFPRPRTPRTGPISGWRSTRSRTCSGCPTSPTWSSSPATPTTSRSRSAVSGSAATSSASASPARSASRSRPPATSSSRYDALPGVPVVVPKKRAKRAKAQEPDDEPEQPDPQAAATGLLERALRIGHEKDDADWLHNSAVKAQMKRMDPSFSEKSLGFRSFSDFLRARSDVVELDESSTTRMVRLKTAAT